MQSITYDFSGTKQDVITKVRAHTNLHRNASPDSAAFLSATSDEIVRRIAHATTEPVTVKVSIDLRVTAPKDDTPSVVGAIAPVAKATPAPSLAAHTTSDLKPAS